MSIAVSAGMYVKKNVTNFTKLNDKNTKKSIKSSQYEWQKSRVVLFCRN